MSSLDKIYGTAIQYRQFRDWAKEANFEYSPYYTPEKYPDSKEFVIVNTSGVEQHLLSNCPLTFVRDWIREKYNLPIDHNLVPHWYLDRGTVELIYCEFERSYLFKNDIYGVKCEENNEYLKLLRCSVKEICSLKSLWFENSLEAEKALQLTAKNEIKRLIDRIEDLEDIADYGRILTKEERLKEERLCRKS